MKHLYERAKAAGRNGFRMVKAQAKAVTTGAVTLGTGLVATASNAALDEGVTTALATAKTDIQAAQTIMIGIAVVFVAYFMIKKAINR